jgi:pimeloyl-ACP methyl ester carboxylesterase
MTGVRVTFGRRAAALALASTLAAVAVGCGSDTPGSTPTAGPTGPTGPAAGASCPVEVAKGRTVRFDDGDGGSIAGVLVGDGPVGVVLSHEMNADACNWLPYGVVLADKGYRVLAIDLPGFGASATSSSSARVGPAVLAAAAYLAQQGSTGIVLMGASLGGTASIVAAGDPGTTPIKGVVTLSSPTVAGSASVVDALPKLTMPVYYIAGKGDSSFAAAVTLLYEATPPKVSRSTLLVDSGGHGTDLLAPNDPVSGQVKAALEKWLGEHAPPTG